MDTEKLEQLYSLKQKGILTEKEYQEQKKILLKIPVKTPMVPWKKAYVSFWKKSFDWSGRATRAEYWWPQLTNAVLAFIIGMGVGICVWINNLDEIIWINIAAVLIGLIFIWPNLSIIVRRFHDLNYKAPFCVIPRIIYYILYYASLFFEKTLPQEHPVLTILLGLYFIVYGVIWELIFPCLPGKKEPNKYGNPR